MEMIKFSELPSGDRMDLSDEDGLPIIASQENRLLTWGRLKKQIAKQTHTDKIEDSEKVPTAKTVNARITEVKKAASAALDTAKSELGEQIDGLRDDLDEKIDDALGKAEGADATAKSALASAGSASRDAQSAENKAIEAVNKAEEALAKATEAPTVDLAPVNEKIATLEQKDTSHDTRLDSLETTQTTIASKLTELQETHEADLKMLNTALTNINEDIKASGEYVLNDALKQYSAGTTGAVDNLEFTGTSWGWGSNHRAGEEVDITTVLTIILENQARFAEALQGIYRIASTRQNDTATILNSITATLNAVTK